MASFTGYLLYSGLMNRVLRRRQLDRLVRPLAKVAPQLPSGGWIKTVREALGMSARQIGQRLGLTQQSVAELERAEQTGSISLKNLRRVAEAMQCQLVYAFLPNESFESIVRHQAEQLADQIVRRVETSMSLEDQATDSEAQRQRKADLTAELVRTTPRNLWDLR
jgi:predicted DNA-binding mobile mystery protein A